MPAQLPVRGHEPLHGAGRDAGSGLWKKSSCYPLINQRSSSASEADAAGRVLSEVAVGEVTVAGGGRELAAAVGDQAASDLLRVLQGFEREAVKVLDVGLRRPTLDDVFLTLTGHETTGPDSTDTAEAAR